MRNLLTYLLLLPLVLLQATGCVDKTTGFLDGIQTEIVFSMDVDGEVFTRAISDGKNIDKLLYAIVNEDGELIEKGEKVLSSQMVPSQNVSITLTLAGGYVYKAIFWAQSSKCTAYTFTDDLKITVDYNGANNDEMRDAFYGVSSAFTLNDNTASVTLKRPFAQINAATYPFDWEYVKDFHKFDVTRSSVRVYDVPSVLNLLDGSVSGKENASFTAAAIPAEDLAADVDGNGVDEKYSYLSMCYVLAGEEETVHAAEFFFLNDEGEAVMFEGTSAQNVKLQRNSHTDYVGQVLSNNGELNRRTYVDEGNDPESGYVYYNVSEPTTFKDELYNLSDHGAGLQFASENGQLVTLENVLFTGDIWTIELGEYRGSFYVNYNNVLNNVEMRNLSVSACIECHEWYFAPAVIAYGVTELNNCVMTGTSTIRTPVVDKHGVEHQVIPVDLGVRNESDAVINGGVYGTVFAWTHAVVEIYDAVIDMLYCGTCDSTTHSWMTIGDGTVIEKIRCCEPRKPYGTKEYSTTMTIKSGAKVGELELVSTDVEFLIIESGASVGKIVCDGVEYTYQELREAMGL